jgi:hypothetical protein
VGWNSQLGLACEERREGGVGICARVGAGKTRSGDCEQAQCTGQDGREGADEFVRASGPWPEGLTNGPICNAEFLVVTPTAECANEVCDLRGGLRSDCEHNALSVKFTLII